MSAPNKFADANLPSEWQVALPLEDRPEVYLLHLKYSLHTTWQFGFAKLVETPSKLTVRKCLEASLALRRVDN